MKSPRKPKADKPVKVAKTTKAHNLIDLSLKEAFLSHATAFERATAKVKAATKSLNEVKKAAKTDGFTVPQIKFALQCATPEGEAIAKSLIASNLLAAAYMDADIGTQFTLFIEPDRTPLTDRAFKEGQTAAMKNETANPKYDPSTEAYRLWMDGYHAEQERQVKAGIGKLEAKAPKADKKAPKSDEPAKRRGRPPKPVAAEPAAAPERVLITKGEKDAKAAAKAPAADSGPPRKPVAEPVTRASLAAAKSKAKEVADSYFSKSSDTKESA